MTATLSIARGDALLLVDVQNDFLPGGALAVPDGDDVLRPLNRYIFLFQEKHLPIFASRDWHPANHASFQGFGGRWPPHCVAGSRGAAFATGLNLPCSAVIVSKATSPIADSYSAFEGTDLEPRLRGRQVNRLFIGGLATDYCVLHTVKDALACGFGVLLLSDAVRAVNATPDDGDRALEKMARLGARAITLKDLDHG